MHLRQMVLKAMKKNKVGKGTERDRSRGLLYTGWSGKSPQRRLPLYTDIKVVRE